ncbi:uncharacterized protein [Physcomitrium patens]|uniref:uncharacterized protein isoform X5 n=1 Tax=Physcomitrium patens TaxID=3218 RepID=UPI000D15C2ED|nr:DEAD-box ATP-dependent RNA helicase 21-like isoform X5 [Physcomitrium patens]|eukprot:XP_024388784.1 DEAD-box ATP-dependent RNA helicase 21-like isoform X5 [Physcomitrella patens]
MSSCLTWRDRDRSTVSNRHHHGEHGCSIRKAKGTVHYRLLSRGSAERSDNHYRSHRSRSTSQDWRGGRDEQSRSPVQSPVHRRSRNVSRDWKDAVTSRCRSREKLMSDEHGCRSHSRDRKRRLDRKETDDSHSQEKKEEEIQREKSKGVEKEKEFSKSKENFGSNQIIEDDQVFPVDGGRPNPRIQENNRKPESQPLSLEGFLKKCKEDSVQQAKPVFLTKAQRVEIALKRRREEAAEQLKRNEESCKLLMGTESKSKSHEDRDQPREKSRERGRDHDHEIRQAREQERDRDRREREREREEEIKQREKERLQKQAQREHEKELELIKEQYLGAKKFKKRVVKPSEKFRFSFDWESTEDTSRDMNPIYQNPHEAQLLFGRGFRAGMDRREQKKLATKNVNDLRKEIRLKNGIEEMPEENVAQKQEDVANLYDAFDMRVDRHWSEKKVEDMTERDWRIFREDYNISNKGSRIPRPMRNWAEGDLSQELLRAVEKVGYTKPSPIQMAAIPIGLQQRDVIGIAETGSGKTAAFVLPMLTYISKLPPMTDDIEAEGPYAVVMAPTRELAQQIEDETVKFAHFLVCILSTLCCCWTAIRRYYDIRVVSIVGGQSIEEQGFKLRQAGYAVLNQCNYVVLDEADRMIDLGFEPQSSRRYSGALFIDLIFLRKLGEVHRDLSLFYLAALFSAVAYISGI